jgi:hypothetical protein
MVRPHPTNYGFGRLTPTQGSAAGTGWFVWRLVRKGSAEYFDDCVSNVFVKSAMGLEIIGHQRKIRRLLCRKVICGELL